MLGNCFYYGGYTPDGYCSFAVKPYFSAGRNYVVRGYSPSAKQRLFNEIKTELKNNGHDCTCFRADGRSDGVFSRSADLRVIDGTYCDDENDFIPVYLDGDCDKSTYEILKKRKEAEDRAVRFLSACRCISNDMMRLENSNIDIAKINRFSTRLWSQTGGELKGSVGTEYKRFVSCITSDGVEINTQAFDNNCDKVTVIADRTGACARRITDRVRRYALSAGYDVISCVCPMNVSVAEHIIIPELHYGIFVNKHYHNATFRGGIKVFASRFFNDCNENKNRIDFSIKAYKSLMQEVFSSLEAVEYCDSELDKVSSDRGAQAIGKSLQLIFNS